jgi:ketosteroid isomerase-like protein
MYHNLNQNDVEKILTPDFIGRHPTGYTWDRESHKNFVTNDLTEMIHEQIAEGDWVATRFTRTGTVGNNPIDVETVHFKRFRDGKISEVLAYFDSKQIPWWNPPA